MSSRRRAEAFERHFADAYRLAHHLTADPRTAETAVIKAFARCFARFEHLRADDIFESALLGETWRAAVPRRDRAAQAVAAARILDHLGIDPGQVAASIPKPKDDTWTQPQEADGLDVVDAIPSSGSLREAIVAGRKRLVAAVATVAVIAGAFAFIFTRDDAPLGEVRIAGRLPEILPQAYAAVGPKVELVKGSLEDKPWTVGAYRAEHRSVCIELRVDDTYGDVHCPSDFKVPLRAYVGPDGRHRTTFLYGYARSDVTDIAVKVKGSPPVGVEIGRDPVALGFQEPGGFFAVTVPGYLLPLSNKQQGESLGYRVYELKLTASGKNGKRLGSQRLLLGRPE